MVAADSLISTISGKRKIELGEPCPGLDEAKGELDLEHALGRAPGIVWLAPPRKRMLGEGDPGGENAMRLLATLGWALEDAHEPLCGRLDSRCEPITQPGLPSLIRPCIALRTRRKLGDSSGR